MPERPFPGYPAFLEAAAERIGHPEASGPARRIATLAALANLCAQASRADASGRSLIVAKAVELRDQLHAAALAADLMLEAVAPASRPPGPDALPRGARRPRTLAEA